MANIISKIYTKRSSLLLLPILISLCFSFIFPSCSDDDKYIDQKDLVIVSNEYKTAMQNIDTTTTLIKQLEEKLETAEDSDKIIIQKQIDNEKEKLGTLQKQKIELEKKLGIKTE